MKLMIKPGNIPYSVELSSVIENISLLPFKKEHKIHFEIITVSKMNFAFLLIRWFIKKRVEIYDFETGGRVR